MYKVLIGGLLAKNNNIQWKVLEGMVYICHRARGGRCIIYHGSFLMYVMTERGVGVRVDGTGERLI